MYYTIEEVAARYRVAHMTVRNWIYAGKVPAIKVGKQWRVKKETIEDIDCGKLTIHAER
jgi:excisionase family DNA binding protein